MVAGEELLGFGGALVPLEGGREGGRERGREEQRR